MKIHVQQLGLAAYIQMRGGQLIGVDQRQFVFETDRPVGAWRVEYTNSECSRHDALVCELREHITPVKGHYGSSVVSAK